MKRVQFEVTRTERITYVAVVEDDVTESDVALCNDPEFWDAIHSEADVDSGVEDEDYVQGTWRVLEEGVPE